MMSSANSKPTVAVVMCTYNGTQHLSAQLESLVAQQWPLALYVFDDTSSDDTIEKLERYHDKLKITININDNNIGYVANFENGISKVLDDGHHYIALCDQDDIWNVERLSAGMRTMQMRESTSGKQVPTLVHSDLTMIGANNEIVHSSFFQYRGYSINNSKSLATILGQNGVMGNTILMNRALATLALPFPSELHVHDYWIAVLAELYGYRELLDTAMVSYRIHSDNASNSNDSIKFGIERLTEGKSWAGFIERDYRLPFKEDSRLNAVKTLLSGSSKLPDITEEQREIIATFQAYLEFKRPRVSRLYTMFKCGFFKKGFKHRIRLVYSMLLTKRYK